MSCKPYSADITALDAYSMSKALPIWRSPEIRLYEGPEELNQVSGAVRDQIVARVPSCTVKDRLQSQNPNIPLIRLC